MRPTKDQYFIDMVKLVATRATCQRRRVGAIITDEEGHVLSTGYNGAPAGVRHCDKCVSAREGEGNPKRCLAVHAELNAILQCHRRDLASILYTTTMPCFQCALAILSTPIKTVIAIEPGGDQDGAKILIEHKRLWVWDNETRAAQLLFA